VPAPVEAAEALLFAARRLIAQLAAWLGARQAATRELTLLAEHDAAPATADPVAAGRRLARSRAVRRAAARAAGAAGAAAPAHTLRLACERSVPLQRAAASCSRRSTTRAKGWAAWSSACRRAWAAIASAD
jgi:protein ImuB